MHPIEVLSLLWSFLLLPLRIAMALLQDVYALVLPQREKSFRGTVALITGAAGSLGREMAVQLAGLGARLVLCDVDEAGLQESGRQVEAVGAEVHLYLCDVTEPTSVEQMAKKVRKEVGHPGLVINSAGVYHHKPLMQHSDQDITSTFAVNSLAPIWLTRAFLEPMTSSNSGHVVFLSSVLGVMGRELLAPYCASKFAVTGFCDALSEELRTAGVDGVTVTCVHPFMVGNVSDVPLDIRVPGVFEVLSPHAAASCILEGVRRGQEELFVPSKLKPLMRINRCLPRRMRRVCQEFVEKRRNE